MKFPSGKRNLSRDRRTTDRRTLGRQYAITYCCQWRREETIFNLFLWFRQVPPTSLRYCQLVRCYRICVHPVDWNDLVRFVGFVSAHFKLSPCDEWPRWRSILRVKSINVIAKLVTTFYVILWQCEDIWIQNASIVQSALIDLFRVGLYDVSGDDPIPVFRWLVEIIVTYMLFVTIKYQWRRLEPDSLCYYANH